MLFHGLAFKPWRIWTRRPLWLKTLIGMLTGVGLGVGFEEQALLLKPLGVLFVNTIQMLMVPLIFCSVIAGLTSLLKGKSLDRIGSKAIGLYLFSTAIAICIGLMMGWLLEPGMGANMGPYERVGMLEQPTLASVLSHLVPRNPVQAIRAGVDLFGDQAWPNLAWHVELHQFRIEARVGEAGQPTPEGAHRDGVDLVAVFLVDRHAVKGGETRVFEATGPSGVRFTLTQPWSLMLLDDARMIHESTPIQPLADGVEARQVALEAELRARPTTAKRSHVEQLAQRQHLQQQRGIVLVIGAAGGPTIPVTVTRAIIGVLDFGMGAQDALAMPFAMSFGEALLIEEGSALVAMKGDLEALGHKGIRMGPAPIKANALGRRADGTWEVSTEPRLVSVVTP